ncbi:hypothetical protein [Cohnella abietis]|uniref:Uncharacterized protein n=1 Tax=Cohnella abietis TaxID=2507935 RepID=A0A3T1D1V5_9BACL|nr:hypothetical protein [Cohnella abietis]BBI32064.1 hypothetical protein KCTCHS21_14630 [Cohnella abietis]
MKAATIPSKEELFMIRESILLPHMMTMVEKSRIDIEQSLNPMRDLISRFMVVMLDTINADLVKIKIAMSKANIKVWDEDHQGDVLYYRYRFRGYEESFGMIREVMRAQISVGLGEYGRKCINLNQRSDHDAPNC